MDAVSVPAYTSCSESAAKLVGELLVDAKVRIPFNNTSMMSSTLDRECLTTATACGWFVTSQIEWGIEEAHCSNNSWLDLTIVNWEYIMYVFTSSTPLEWF